MDGNPACLFLARVLSVSAAPPGLDGLIGAFPGLRFACPGLFSAVPPGRETSLPLDWVAAPDERGCGGSWFSTHLPESGEWMGHLLCVSEPSSFQARGLPRRVKLLTMTACLATRIETQETQFARARPSGVVFGQLRLHSS